MLCQHCKKVPATVHSIEIIGGKKKEIHLCGECAKTKGLPIKPSFSVSDFLTTLIEGHLQEASEHAEEPAELKCGACGLTYSDFKNVGRLGCPNDYNVFGEQLMNLLERIHGNTQHRGKVPSRAGKEIRRYKKIMEMKIELEKAIAREDYEAAAKLRDEIAMLKELEGPDDNENTEQENA